MVELETAILLVYEPKGQKSLRNLGADIWISMWLLKENV
jgi:hypothetical protein